MNLLVDFTLEAEEQLAMSLEGLELYEEVDEIKFILPVFLFMQNNFRLLINYMSYLSRHPLTKTVIEPSINEQEIKLLEQYKVVLVRGTFDRLHLGHQVLLLKAIYSASQRLIIQIKGDSLMTNKHLRQLIQPIQVRKQNIKKFVQSIKPQLQIKLQVIKQVYGSTPYSKGINAVVISEQSIHAFHHINRLRKNAGGLKRLQMIKSPLMTLNKEEVIEFRQQRILEKISSRRIREYILSQNGFSLEEYVRYRGMWDSLVKELGLLCRVKEVDAIVVERWWERIVKMHTVRVNSGMDANGVEIKQGQKEINQNEPEKNNTTTILNLPKSHSSLKNYLKKLSNRQIYQQIIQTHTRSRFSPQSQTSYHQSLKQMGMTLSLLFQGFIQQEQQQQKNINTVIRLFFESLLRRKSKSKSCKKIKRMLVNYVKEFVGVGGKQQKGGDQVRDNNKIDIVDFQDDNALRNLTVQESQTNITLNGDGKEQQHQSSITINQPNQASEQFKPIKSNLSPNQQIADILTEQIAYAASKGENILQQQLYQQEDEENLQQYEDDIMTASQVLMQQEVQEEEASVLLLGEQEQVENNHEDSRTQDKSQQRKEKPTLEGIQKGKRDDTVGDRSYLDSAQMQVKQSTSGTGQSKSDTIKTKIPNNNNKHITGSAHLNLQL